MVKTIRIIGIAILLFFLIKICNKESAPPVDYNKIVEAGLSYINHAYDKTYKLDISFRNNHSGNISDILAEFIFMNTTGKEILRLKRNVLPAGYSLSSGAKYPYRMYFDSAEEPFLKRVNIIYAK